MSGEINKPGTVRFHIARNSDGSVLHVGTTEADQVTSTGQPTLESHETEGAQLTALAAFVAQFPALPESGWLEVGARYAWNGAVVEVRQSHERTIYTPSETPALFFFALPPGEGQGWIVGEWVPLGTRRAHAGVLYSAIQAHQTQAGWEPPNVPALWEVVVVAPPGKEAWSAGTNYLAGGEERAHNGQDWLNRRANNTQQLAPGTNDSGWIQTSNRPAPWYSLGNEGYPLTLAGTAMIVTHNGRLRENTLAGNTWTPGVFGWTDLGPA